MKIICLKIFYALLLPLVLLLGGCCPVLCQHDDTAYRVVTQIHILYENDTVQTQRTFLREETMHPIIEYLRYIDPYGIPREDPELSQGRNFTITLVYSDGSECIYQQREDKYLRINGGKWKRIDPQKALILSGLYTMMPGDQPLSTEPVPALIMPQI